MKQDYRNLLVWQKAVEFVTEIYQVTNTFPREELFGLTSQIRRAAISIPSNIAEGQARRTRGEFQQFLGIAKGSLAELDTQLLIASNLRFISMDVYEALTHQLSEIARMLNALLNSLANN